MGRPKGSKNRSKALVSQVPVPISMYRKVTSNRTYGLLPCPYPFSMYDCCDYYVCEVLPGDGVFDTYFKFGAKKITTEQALQARNLSVRSDQELLIKFVTEYPERLEDLRRYLPDDIKTDKKQRIVIEAPKYDLNGLTRRELTEILKDTEINEGNASYLAAVSNLLNKMKKEESSG